jgi:mercuric ion binding protein
MRRTLICLLLLAASALAAPPAEVTLNVPGMTCSACPIAVRKALERLPGVEWARVDYKQKTAHVRFDPERVTPEALTDATLNAGFPSTVQAQRP